MPRPQIATIGMDIMGQCLNEAARCFPLETGGAFMGARRSDGAFRVLEMIGPGENATHNRHSFQPDPEWQWAEMDRLFQRYDGKINYLGDWHTHPGASHGELSYTDRKALREILACEETRQEVVVSAIFFGRSEINDCKFWSGQLEPRRLLWLRLSIKPLALELEVNIVPPALHSPISR